ncbi:MAG TPA: ADP-ribosylglycohydrolase family protein [Candidatus Dormibacteraeota bacterium]
MVLASAAGDALGAPHEFASRISATTPLTMSGGGPFGFGPGEWTDDTQMALALLVPLAAGDTSIAAVEDGFLSWHAAGPRDVGSQTRAVLTVGAPLTAAAAQYLKYQPGSAGNGGLMRVGPAALSFPHDPRRIRDYAAASTAITHADADCIDDSVLWALAIDRAIYSAPDASDALIDLSRRRS